MAEAPPSASHARPADRELVARLEAAGRTLGQREAPHCDDLRRARDCAVALHAVVAEALERFHAAAAVAGAEHLRVELGPVRADDKHLRSVEFELQRGRYKAIVTAKSRGDVSLVGPFRTGKVEGPCLSFPFDAEGELRAALGDFLERFVEEAATP